MSERKVYRARNLQYKRAALASIDAVTLIEAQQVKDKVRLPQRNGRR